MVLPAIAATGRVIAGSTQTTARASRVKRDPLQRTAIRTRRDGRRNASLLRTQLRNESPELSNEQLDTHLPQITKGIAAQSNSLNSKHKKKNVSPINIARTAFRYIRAVAAAFTTMAFYFWFYLMQLGAGMVFIVANYADTTWVGWFMGAYTISIIGWVICSTISLIFMFVAIVSLVTVRAEVERGLTMIMFLVGVTASIVPYFNLFPWPAFFMATAVANQK